MADIRVKPTKRTPAWVWVVAVLLLAAAVIALVVFGPEADAAPLSLLPL